MDEIHPIKMSGLADSGSFALEYLLLGNILRAKELMPCGIEFCRRIERSHEDDAVKSKASEIKEKLSFLLSGNITYTENFLSIKEIREYQKFFNDTSMPYLKKAYIEMKKLEAKKRFPHRLPLKVIP